MTILPFWSNYLFKNFPFQWLDTSNLKNIMLYLVTKTYSSKTRKVSDNNLYILLKCEAISLDSYIWSSTGPIFMILFSNASTRCVDEKFNEKLIYQLNCFAHTHTHTHVYNPHYSYLCLLHLCRYRRQLLLFTLWHCARTQSYVYCCVIVVVW